jgi:hypothetical protein
MTVTTGFTTTINGIQYVSDPSSTPFSGLAIGGAGANAALATTATLGFPQIPTCAGQPTGVPTVVPGFAPIVYDTTNDKFWVYDPVDGAWEGVVLA